MAAPAPGASGVTIAAPDVDRVGVIPAPFHRAASTIDCAADSSCWLTALRISSAVRPTVPQRLRATIQYGSPASKSEPSTAVFSGETRHVWS